MKQTEKTFILCPLNGSLCSNFSCIKNPENPDCEQSEIDDLANYIGSREVILNSPRVGQIIKNHVMMENERRTRKSLDKLGDTIDPISFRQKLFDRLNPES